MQNQITYRDFETVRCELHDNRVSLIASGISTLPGCRQGLFWRYCGDTKWQLSVSDRLDEITKAEGNIRFQCGLSDVTAVVDMAPHDATRGYQLSGYLVNGGNRPIELSRFCYLMGELPSDLGFLELEGALEKPYLRMAGDPITPYRETVEELWMSMGVQWPRLPDPIHDTANWAVSKDVAAFVTDWQSSGWGFGFNGPGSAFGEIGYKADTKPVEFYVGVLLDNIVLDPGEMRVLESVMAWYGDWQEGLKQWARSCANTAGVKELNPPLLGYCSWYQNYTGITADDILRATNEFKAWQVRAGGRTIQIDDGFQIAPGNWLPNDRFASIWKELPGLIAETGSIPGIWLAPTMVHESHPMVSEHPDWVQRVDGEPAIYFSNWGKTYALESDHPEVQRYMAELLRQYADDGWEYFKVDFCYPVSTARKAWDRKKTSFQTLRELFELMRSSIGSEALLSACIGVPGRYALGSADFARLGGDIGSSWDAVKQTVRAWLIWSCTHGVWWQGDPDVFMMRTENSSLNFEESCLLTGTIGLFGGMFLTSDFPSQWSPESVAVIHEIWNQHGMSTTYDYRICWDNDQNVRAYRVSRLRDGVMHHAVGLYNWGAETQMTSVSLEDTGLNPSICWSLYGEGVHMNEGRLVVDNQPAHSLRIAHLTAL